jgi:NAD(P)H-hydrate repair Nnr-like enzyme with NAD(P)H-hydrate dehydratase domain
MVLPKGRHLVELKYRPFSVFAGLGLTLAGILAGWLARKLDAAAKL